MRSPPNVAGLEHRLSSSYTLAMPYVVEYFKEGQKVGSAQWKGTLVGTQRVAEDGLIRHQADSYRIIDDDTGAEVASGRRD